MAEEHTVSNRPEWDRSRNADTLYRYVSCKNERCPNDEQNQHADDPRHKFAGYSFYPKQENFHCEKCGEVAHSELEYNEDSDDYVYPKNYTVIMSGFFNNERATVIYHVEASTERNAYAAAIRRMRREFAYTVGQLHPTHIATYVGHLKALREGEKAYWAKPFFRNNPPKETAAA